jgi:hypothetical protein
MLAVRAESDLVDVALVSDPPKLLARSTNPTPVPPTNPRNR